ncbi:MAG: bifunctional riboflavin kinase/FAD synthetase [Actinomycetota bacterium]
MEVVRGVEALPLPARPAVVTVGMFDGVHRGHQAVIGRTVDVARDRGVMSVATTFDRHPREVLTHGHEPRLLTTLERKIALIEALGVDVLLVLQFTLEFSKTSPEDFVGRFLVESVHAAHVVLGANFRFGHRAQGDLAYLHESGPANGFTAEGVDLLEIHGRRVSSSSIRESLAAGDLDWPRTGLSRRFAVDGRVVRGAGRGTGLGWPTANLETHPRIQLPAVGVYAGRALSSTGEHVAAINVGSNPTFGEEPVHIEAFLLDYEGDLLGQDISIEFWQRLRDEVRFDSAEELSEQIADDVERTRDVAS